MTLKVLQGLVGTQGRPTVNQPSSASSDTQAAATNAQQIQRLVSSAVGSTEAVVSSVKAIAKKSTVAVEKVKSYEEAKELSVKLADKIEREESIDAHSGLDYVSKSSGKQGHLLS